MTDLQEIVDRAMANGGKLTRRDYLRVRWIAWRNGGSIFVRRQHGGEW